MGDFYSSRIVKAKKEHKCFHCNGIIKIGEKYHYAAALYCGDFSTVKSHISCSELLNLALEYEQDNEYDNCSVYEYIRSNMCYGCDKEEDCDQDCIYECGKKLLEVKGGK